MAANRAAQRRDQSARAKEPHTMILDVTQPLLDYDGTPSYTILVDREGNEKERTPIFLRKMIVQGLDATYPDTTPEEKTDCFLLAVKIASTDKVTLSSEEASLIKKWSGRANPKLPHGRICEAIEAAGNPITDDDPDGGQ